MNYMRCPTCGNLLGNKVLIYTAASKEYCNKYGIDVEQTSKILSTDDDIHEEYKTAMRKVLTDLLENYCCRMRIQHSIDVVRIIKGKERMTDVKQVS